LLAADVPAVETLPAAAEQGRSESAFLIRLRALVELTKPGITRLVVITTAAGFYLATNGSVNWLLFLNTLIGTGLVAGGSGALNQWLERDADSRMHRTQSRTIPSGRLSTRAALFFALGISVTGIIYTLLFVGLLPAAVVVTSLVTYLFVYTPLKRKTWLNTVIGAVPGALPILAGWTAAGGRIDAIGLSLFGILFLWQMPHFFALAWIFREDYLRGGFRMLTAFDETGRRTARQAVLFTLALLPVSLLPAVLGLSSGLYVAGAALLGTAYLALGVALLARRSAPRAWRLFFASVVYLPLLLLLMVLDKGFAA
jgi:protoheme IX farnesyltransferase